MNLSSERDTEKTLRTKEIKISDISVLSAHDIDTSLLLDFYDINYPVSAKGRIWQWLNRSSFYGNKVPLVILYNNRVIAHAGMIPFRVFLDERYYTASWFVDFMVRPEFQGKRLGTLIAKKWMEFSDICVEIGHNKGSGSIFRQLSWLESSETYLHYYLILPFNNPRFEGLFPAFLREVLNAVSWPFFRMIYSKYASSLRKVSFQELKPDLLNAFTPHFNRRNGMIMPVRDSDYVSWRLLNSPQKDKYRIFSISGINDVNMVIKLCDKDNSKYIDILWVSDSFRYSVIQNMISTLAIWGMTKAYSYIRYYTSRNELSSYLKRSLKPAIRYPGFMFCSKDTRLLEKLKGSSWNWELIDSDFEEF